MSVRGNRREREQNLYILSWCPGHSGGAPVEEVEEVGSVTVISKGLTQKREGRRSRINGGFDI